MAKQKIISAHAKLSPSAMDRWSVCAASIRLSEGIPSTTSKYAEEGTRMHDAVAHYLTKNEWPDDFVKKEGQEAQDHCYVYIQHVFKLLAETGGELFVEKKFSLEKLVPGMFGTADAVVYDAKTKTLHVIDLKYGAGYAVEAKGNTQMRCYAVGAMMDLSHLRVDKVVMTIVQPRAEHRDGPIRSDEIDAMDLMDFAGDLIGYAAATENPDAPTVSGEHCRFCPAAATCPELKKTANELAAIEFKAAVAYDPAVLGDVLNKLPLLSGWIESVKEFAYSEMTAGRAVPGWKLVPKRANRSWIDEDVAADTISVILPEEEMFETKLKSPAQMEKALGAKNKKLLEPLVQQISSGTTIAPDSDGREAVDRNAKAALDFK